MLGMGLIVEGHRNGAPEQACLNLLADHAFFTPIPFTRRFDTKRLDPKTGGELEFSLDVYMNPDGTYKSKFNYGYCCFMIYFNIGQTL